MYPERALSLVVAGAGYGSGKDREEFRRDSAMVAERFKGGMEAVAEFYSRGPTRVQFQDKDPKGWAIHNALWAGLTSFVAGGPMPWWHERYIDKLDLYFHFDSLAQFARDLPLGTARWEMLETTTPAFSLSVLTSRISTRLRPTSRLM